MAEDSLYSLAKRVFRFGLTGCMATLIHVGVVYLWMQLEQPSPSAANAAAYAIATVFTYLLHTLWSFSSQIKVNSLLRFLAVTVAGLLVSAGLSGYVDWLGYSYIYGVALVVCVIPPLNFIAHHFWTYRQVRETHMSRAIK